MTSAAFDARSPEDPGATWLEQAGALLDAHPSALGDHERPTAPQGGGAWAPLPALPRVAVVARPAHAREVEAALGAEVQVVLLPLEPETFAYLAEDPPQAVVVAGDPRDLDRTAAGIGRLRAEVGPERCAVAVIGVAEREAAWLRLLAAGADALLRRPLAAFELRARVRRWLAPRTGARPPRPCGAAAASDPLAGLEGGRFTDVRPLGSGSFGAVFDCLDARRGRRVALKVLACEAAAAHDARARFLREVYALQAVRSPHLCELLDAGDDGGRLWFTSELVPGPTLAAYVRERGPLDDAQTTELVLALARALCALERAGLVHRDLKPANVILRDGRVDRATLVDFGIAKRPLDHALTSSDMLMGTPGYMAPEYVAGASPDRRADLFSLGAVGRFAATGEDPHPGMDPTKLLLLMGRVRLSLPAALDPQLRRVLRRLLELTPGRRHASANLVVAELRLVRAALARRPVAAMGPTA